MGGINRGEVMDSLCAKIGIAKRACPNSSYLSKRELLQLTSWIDVVKSKLAKLEFERKAT